MYPVGVSFSLIVVFVLWLSVISYLVWKQRTFLKDFLPVTTDKGTILEQFAHVLEEIRSFRAKGDVLQKNVRSLSFEGLSHLQKVALLRYNPYGDTGGEQSFTVVLLSGAGDGVLITSLHTRAGTRIYAKEIKDGKSELHLSTEEKKTLDKALNKG
jgi:hypothetical protein